MLEAGIKGTKEITVTNENTAKTMGSGTLDVFATPAMIALMENTAYESVAAELEEVSGKVHEVTHHGCPRVLEAPDVAECGSEELVRIFSMVSHEFLELHVSPEMREVEEENAENHDTEHEHVACGPGVGSGPA